MPSLNSVKDQSFKQACEAFLAQHWPHAVSDSLAQSEQWRRALVRQGWSVPAWPAAFGGMEWSLAEQFYWRHLCRQAGVPSIWDPGVDIVGPFLIGLLTARGRASAPPADAAEHLEPHLNAIREMRTRWCLALVDAHNSCELSGQASFESSSLPNSQPNSLPNPPPDPRSKSHPKSDSNPQSIQKNSCYTLQGSVKGIDNGCDAQWMLLQVAPSEGPGEAWVLVELEQSSVRRADPHSLDPTLCPEICFEALQVPSWAVFVDPPIGEPLRSLMDMDGVGTLSAQLRTHLDALQALVDAGDDAVVDANFDTGRLASAQIALKAYTGMEMRWLDAAQRGLTPPYPAALLKLKGDEIFDQVGHLLLDSFGYDVLLDFDEPDHIAYHNEDPARKHAISDRLEEKLDHDVLGSQVGMMNVEQRSRADLKRGIRRLIRHHLARVGQSNPLLRDQLVTVLDSHRGEH